MRGKRRKGTKRKKKENQQETKKKARNLQNKVDRQEINLQPSPFSRHVSLTVLHMTMSIRRDCDCSGCCEDDVVIAWWGVDAVDARLQTTNTAGTDGDESVVGQTRVSL